MRDRTALAILGVTLSVVAAGFSYYILVLDVPGYLASWSFTVLGFGLWLWPLSGLMRSRDEPDDHQDSSSPAGSGQAAEEPIAPHR